MIEIIKRLEFLKKFKYIKFYCLYLNIFVLIIFVFTILFNSASIFAKTRSSLEPFLILFKKNDCHSLILKLKPFNKKESWVNRDLWIRSQILNAKCEIEMGNNDRAVNILDRIKEKEFFDALIFQKIRALLKSKKHLEAVNNIRKLLAHPKKNFYLRFLREEIKSEFVTDKEAMVIFPLLHETNSNHNWFLKDFQINSLYLRGARLNGEKLDSKFQLLGWQYPIDEETARSSQKKLSSKDIKIIPSKNILRRIQTLSNLKLNKYLIEHIPQLRISKDKELLKSLGEIFLKSLFRESFYTRIINLHKNGILTKTWAVPKESQLYWTARAYIKRKDIPNGRSTIYKLERHNSKSRRLPALFDTLATRYMIDLETDKAQFWWERLIKNFPKHYLAKKSIWLMSWTNIQANKFDKALIYLNKGLNSKIYNSEVKAKFLYWHGKLYEKLGKNELAKKSYKKLLLNQPNTYYGMRLISSENNLKSVFDTKISHQKAPFYESKDSLNKKYKSLLRRSEFLFDIFESELAIDEIFKELGNYKNGNLNWHFSHQLHERGAHKKVLKIIANYFLPYMIKLREKESSIWELAYPRPYWQQLKNYSNQAGIDPYFALAIMREESHFDPKALSSSKAMGLMQLMLATAKDVAKRNKIRLDKKEDIFTPKINIKLGTFYLGRLAKKFQSELIYTAGGYNAGPHNMKKWINRWNGITLDKFVEEIPFNETRNYVKRVYRSYKIYNQIYRLQK